VKLLGVTLDSSLTMDRHVAGVLRSCNYHMRALRHIRPLLIHDADKMIAHSAVSSRLDYANALLYGTTTTNLNKLQVAQNTLARVMCQAPRSVSATELRRQLHWLPIRQRITYRIAVITYVELAGLPAPPTSHTLHLYSFHPSPIFPFPNYTAGNLEILPDLS